VHSYSRPALIAHAAFIAEYHPGSHPTQRRQSDEIEAFCVERNGSLWTFRLAGGFFFTSMTPDSIEGQNSALWTERSI
jgi:hypothetical protein